MANPGVYFPYASETAWPFLALAGGLLSVPVLGFAVLMLITGHVSRMRSAAGAILALAIAAVSVAGLIKADSDFREEDIAHRTAYVGEARAWLQQGYRVNLTDAELSEILTAAGISGEFEGATAFITVRGDQNSGDLVVTDRDGTVISPLKE